MNDRRFWDNFSTVVKIIITSILRWWLVVLQIDVDNETEGGNLRKVAGSKSLSTLFGIVQYYVPTTTLFLLSVTIESDYCYTSSPIYIFDTKGSCRNLGTMHIVPHCITLRRRTYNKSPALVELQTTSNLEVRCANSLSRLFTTWSFSLLECWSKCLMTFSAKVCKFRNEGRTVRPAITLLLW